jgi:type I restriction enzyme, S subunit
MGGVRMEQVNSPWGFLPRGWRLSTIDEEKERLTDYVANGSFASLASNVHYKDTEDYAVLIRLVDFNNDFKGPFVYIDEHAYSFLSKSSLSGGEIIISNVGANVGTVFKCPNLPYKMSLAPNAITIKLKGDNDFYYYWFKSKIGQANIQALVTGSAQPKFNKTNFRSMYIPVPPLDVQRRIASILSSLDRKIELNNKINADLEEMAQAIFKNWFVDFEPFKDGKFVDSELGMIPEGWKVGRLTEIASYMNGLAMQKFPPENNEDSLPVLKIKELGQGFCGTDSDRCSCNIKDECKIHNGDVIFSWSGTLLVDVWCGGDCGLNQHLFKVTSKDYPKWFYYYWTKHHLQEFIHIAKDKAVTMGHIKRGHLEEAMVAIPDNDSMEKAHELFEPILSKMISLRLENSRLSTLRDTLLPRLMSGELEVPE